MIRINHIFPISCGDLDFEGKKKKLEGWVSTKLATATPRQYSFDGFTSIQPGKGTDVFYGW